MVAGSTHPRCEWMAIGNAEDDRDDDRDAENIYKVLENDVLPLEEDGDGWSNMMKASIAASLDSLSSYDSRLS